MGFAREMADRVVVFDSGDIIETGIPEIYSHTPRQKRTGYF